MKEQDIQKVLIKHIVARGMPDLVWLHCNNNPRSARDGARLKAMGLIKGAPDLLYFYRGQFFAHELKTLKGRCSPEQLAFHERFLAAGGLVIITHGLDDAINALVDIGLITRG